MLYLFINIFLLILYSNQIPAKYWMNSTSLAHNQILLPNRYVISKIREMPPFLPVKHCRCMNLFSIRSHYSVYCKRPLMYIQREVCISFFVRGLRCISAVINVPELMPGIKEVLVRCS